MTKFESRIGKIQSPQEKVYNFLSDFNNFKHIIPEDKVNEWKSDPESCSFKVSGVGDVGLKMVEKEPYDLIKITGNGLANVEFFLWIQLKKVSENDTRVKITMKADLNPMLKMAASKPMNSFLEIVVNYMENFSFDHQT